MDMGDTIVAIATPPGEGGLGVLRLSGPAAVALAAEYFHAADGRDLREQPERLLAFGWWIDPVSLKKLDEVLCVRFQAPRSFTGEDVVELHAHGGAFHMQALLQGLLESGARLARPGEFTQRAFINGRMDLTRAEAVVDLIRSSTDLSHEAATRQLAGGLAALVEGLRDAVIDCCAQVEAAVDFPEEEDQLLPRSKLLERVRACLKSMQDLLEGARAGRMLNQGIRVALVGVPNVGKSSLMNALLGRERSIVTAVAGTTRDYIEERLNLQGFPVLLTDTAGLRVAADLAEAEGVKRSRERMLAADIVLMLVDSTEDLNPQQIQKLLEGVTADVIYVVTKADLNPYWNPESLKGALAVSSKTSQGLEALKARVLEVALRGKAAALVGKAALTQVRHEDAMRRAQNALKHVEATLNAGNLSAEFLSSDLRDALDALGEIVGKTAREDVVNAIFSKFCIGK